MVPLICLLIFLVSCTTTGGLPVYQASSIGMPQITLRGRIESVRVVKISGLQSGVNKGAAIGSVAGGALGSVVAGEGHRLVGLAIGSAAGLLAGQAVNSVASPTLGNEYQVLADNGRRYTMVQPANVVFAVGDSVLISLPRGNNPGRLIPVS
jgi:outer membrane lipoprotein SlyB